MIAYILEVTLYWGLLYGLYYLVLRRLTFFAFNRYFLLFSLVLGLIIPAVKISLSNTAPLVEATPLLAPIVTVPLHVQNLVTEETQHINWSWWIIVVYWIGVGISLAKLSHGLFKLWLLYRQSEKKRFTNYILVQTPQLHVPFSFLHYVFWSKDLQAVETDSGPILVHEISHVKGWHSVDILLVEIIQSFMWCSPPIYLYRRSLRTLHEYLADQTVLQSMQARSYGQLLIRHADSHLQIALANHFIQSQLKNRIMMMFKQPSRRWALWHYILIIPALLCLLLLVAAKNTNQEQLKLTPVVTDTIYRAYILVKPNHERIYFLQMSDNQEVLNKVNQLFSRAIENQSEVVAKKENDAMIFNLPVLEVFEYKLNSNNCDLGLPEVSEIQKSKDYTGDIIMRFYPDKTMISGDRKLSAKINVENYKPTEEIQNFINDPKRGFIPSKYENDPPVYRPDQEDVFKVVEEMPRFPGCEDIKNDEERQNCAKEKLMAFIYENIKYPTLARNTGIEGQCVVRMVIEKDGSISEAELVKDIGGGCGDEAVRVIKAMNELPQKWIPGRQRGMPVRVEYLLPVKFKLEPRGEPMMVIFAKNSTRGEIVDSKFVASFPPELIESIHVYKGPNAKEKYPEAAESGVVEIHTKLNTLDELKKNLTEKVNKLTDDEIFKVVEEQPLFPGCNTSTEENEKLDCSKTKLLNYIYQNITYPPSAREAGIQGQVVIRFVVEKDGTLSNLEVVKEIGGGCGEAAKQVFEKMNWQGLKWTPAKQRGKVVRVVYNVPVKFKLEETKSDHVNGSMAAEVTQKQTVVRPVFGTCTNNDERCSNEEFIKYVYQNIHYPLEARKINNTGIVRVQWTVNKQGRISAQVSGEQMHKAIISDVQRLFNDMPAWKPATQHGNPVDYSGTTNIAYILEGKDKRMGPIVENDPNTLVVVGYLIDSDQDKLLPRPPASEIENTLEVVKLKVFPNPANAKIEIQFAAEAKPLELMIFDVNYKQFYTEKLASFNGIYHHTVNLTNAPAGTYFLVIKQGDKTYTHQLVLKN